ncbi:hypothetical protein OBBRIDRAFT_868075 [Obba rivulosa]|uniref:Uncharacterized protein n=1 Tax=Obba rivulosa TaxID=1052685 RepID=A0A8E2AGM8_9APHY|nr:hypothetical protein OBBRIDRAFT_868075 [Obba rivulosa]
MEKATANGHGDPSQSPAETPVNCLAALDLKPFAKTHMSGGQESPLKKCAVTMTSPLKIELRKSMASISSLRPYAKAQNTATETIQKSSDMARYVGQQVTPWSELNWQVSPKKEPTKTTVVFKLTQRRTLTPAPDVEPSPVFQLLKDPVVLSAQEGLRSACPAPHHCQITSGIFCKELAFMLKDRQSASRISPQEKRGLGLSGTLGGAMEPVVDPKDPDLDIVDELQSISALEDDSTPLGKPMSQTSVDISIAINFTIDLTGYAIEDGNNECKVYTKPVASPGSMRSKASEGQLNMDLKFGGKPTIAQMDRRVVVQYCIHFSYSTIIDSSAMDPFVYGSSWPPSEDMGRQHQHVDSDASSFYFQAPGAQLVQQRRGHRRHECWVKVMCAGGPLVRRSKHYPTSKMEKRHAATQLSCSIVQQRVEGPPVQELPKEAGLVERPSIASMLSYQFGSEHMIMAHKGLLKLQSLDHSALIAHGEDLLASFHVHPSRPHMVLTFEHRYLRLWCGDASTLVIRRLLYLW